MSFAQRRGFHRVSEDFRQDISPPRQNYRSGSTGKRVDRHTYSSRPKSRSPWDNDAPHVYCAGVRIYPSSSANSINHNYGVRSPVRRGVFVGRHGGRTVGSWTRGRGGRRGLGISRITSIRADVSPVRNPISVRTAIHAPSYDISPDRTNVDIPEIDNRKELLRKMRLAKDNDNLDEYYRYRELLNAGVASSRRSFRTKDVDINDLELEEIDCIDVEEETSCVEGSRERKRSKGSKHRRATSKEEKASKSSKRESTDGEKSSRRAVNDEKAGKTSSDAGIKRKLAEGDDSDEQRHGSVHRYKNDNGIKVPKIDGNVESKSQQRSGGGEDTLKHPKVMDGEADEDEDEDDATFLQFAEDSVDVEAMVKAAATGDEDHHGDGYEQEDGRDEDDVEEEDTEGILGADAVMLDMSVEPTVGMAATTFLSSHSIATAPIVPQLKNAPLGRLLAFAMKSISTSLASCGYAKDDMRRIAESLHTLSNTIRLFSRAESAAVNDDLLKGQKGESNVYEQSTDVPTLAELSLGTMMHSFLSNECRTQRSE